MIVNLRCACVRVTVVVVCVCLSVTKMPQSWVVRYSLLYIATTMYSGNPNYGHWNHAPMDKIQISFECRQARLAAVKDLKNVCCCWRHWQFLSILQCFKASLYSRSDLKNVCCSWRYWQFLSILLCFKASLHSRSASMQHTATGKGHHIIGCTPCIKDTSL